jgi:hypothetical protein
MASILACIVIPWTSVNAQEMKNEPSFKWDATFASPSTSLTVEEALRPPRAGTHQAVFYRIKATGFSSDEPLSLWVKRGMRYFKFPATVTNEGAVQVKKGRDNLGALVVLAYQRDEGFAVVASSRLQTKALLMAGFAEGHPLDVALVSEGGGKRAHAKAVPIPLRAEGNEGCSASAELQSETGLLFLVNLKGFLPGEVVQIQSQYKKEVASSTKPASQSGELAFPVLFGKGDRGTASLIATTDRCTVKLEYKVGDDALVR